jgi:hypothetical protein
MLVIILPDNRGLIAPGDSGKIAGLQFDRITP